MVFYCLVLTVAVVGIMGDELTLSDVMAKMTQMERKIHKLERQIGGIFRVTFPQCFQGSFCLIR